MKLLFFVLTLGISTTLIAQKSIDLKYEVSTELPFGAVNPEAKEYLSDFAPMIGQCDCKSINRKPDGNWGDTVNMIWKFKYIMNGHAIQDETWKADGKHSGSIRQFQPDSAQWVVTYFSQSGVTFSPGVWIGGKDGQEIVLKKEQKSPNGMEGFSKLTFSDISTSGYNWIGAWISLDESIVYPFWKIHCYKQKK
ncbi:MAG: hypothetical protein R2728_10165 [Chitinophagales bacterium]